MKKILLVIMVALFFNLNSVFAQDFDNLEGITPAQKQKLSQIHFRYKNEYNSIEQNIIEYNSKLAKLSQETDKSPSDIAMLKSAYERNLKTLKAQQEKLDIDVDELYKSILTEEQYKQYKAQKVQTQEAFNNFLQK